MKFNYFKTLEDKYKTRLSMKSPIIIRLDGKNICKNKEINMVDESENGFAYALKKTGLYLSRKFECIALVASDEINLIILDPNKLKRIYGHLECQKTSSLIAQEVYFVFNSNFHQEQILFDARTFNIPENKINSYIIHRSQTAKNVYTIYYAKKILSYPERAGLKSVELEELLCKLSYDFKNRSSHNRVGSIYINGNNIDLDTTLKSNIKFNTPISINQFTSDAIIIDDDSEDDLFF